MGRTAHARDASTIDFHGHQLAAFRDHRGTFVGLKHIVEAIGLTWSAQACRLQRDPVLRSGRIVEVLPTEGGPQACVCLRIDLLHGWLFTLRHARLAPAAAKRVRLFQRECCAALAKAFDGSADRPWRRVGEPSVPAFLAFAQREALAAAHP